MLPGSQAPGASAVWQDPGPWGEQGSAGAADRQDVTLHQVSLGLCVQITLSARPVLKVGDSPWWVRAPGPRRLGDPGVPGGTWGSAAVFLLEWECHSIPPVVPATPPAVDMPPRTPEPPLLTHSSRASGWAGQQVHTRALSREPLSFLGTQAAHLVVPTALLPKVEGDAVGLLLGAEQVDVERNEELPRPRDSGPPAGDERAGAEVGCPFGLLELWGDSA